MRPRCWFSLALTLLSIGCWEDEPTTTPTPAPAPAPATDSGAGPDTDTGCATPLTCFPDSDGDGHGAGAVGTEACDCPPGTASTADDCDDGAPGTYLGAAEVCDGADNDCDGVIDHNSTDGTWYRDRDGDGYGSSSGTSDCEPKPDSVEDNTDCDDDQPDVHPGAPEVCNSDDDDCDGEIDEDATIGTYHVDADLDGSGDAADPGSCTAAAGTVPDGSDCDDSDPDVHPGATEDCSDGRDNDCSGLLDCEEERCEEEAACIETVCDDGLDSDGDGRVDCEDDDCMGHGCGTVRFTLHGGSMTALRTRAQYYYHEVAWGDCSSILNDLDGLTFEAVVESASGTIQAYSSGGAWTESCSWFVARAQMANYRYKGVNRMSRWVDTGTSRTCRLVTWGTEKTWGSEVTREGVIISDGCSVPVEALLPEQLTFSSLDGGEPVWMDEYGVWYSGVSDEKVSWDDRGTGWDLYFTSWTVDSLGATTRVLGGPGASD